MSVSLDLLPWLLAELRVDEIGHETRQMQRRQRPLTAWQAMLHLAQTHEVLPWLGQRLLTEKNQNGIPEAIKPPLQQTIRQVTMDNLHRYGEWRRIQAAMQAVGIDLLALKGLYLAAGMYSSMGLRPMRDTDLLARPEQALDAVSVLRQLGYDDMVRRSASYKHLPPLGGAHGQRVEIHDRITEANEPFAVDLDRIWSQAEWVELAGVRTRVLSLEDMLLHLCIHAAFQHRFAFGLKSLVDVTVLLTTQGKQLDWDILITRAYAWRANRCVHLTLFLASDLLGTAVPTDILMLETDVAEIQTQARELVLNRENRDLALSHNFTNLWQSGRWREKGQTVRRALFLPRVKLAGIYGIPANSWRLYGYYGIRLWDLLVRYGRNALAAARGEKLIIDQITTDVTLTKWLAGDDENK